MSMISNFIIPDSTAFPINPDLEGEWKNSGKSV